MFDFNIKIADRTLRFKSSDASLSYNAREEREFKHFVCDDSKRVDATLEIRYGFVPMFNKKKVVFSVVDGWSLSRYKNKMLFEYPDRGLEGRMERAAEISEDMTRGIIYVNGDRTSEEQEKVKNQVNSRPAGTRKIKLEERKKRKIAKPPEAENKQKTEKKRNTPEDLGRKVMSGLKANFFQAFLIEYLVLQKVGFLAHCASVRHNDKLYLFMGQSNFGKSTIAEFWHDAAGARVFNDDRAVLTVENGSPYFYNAPWVGTLVNKCDLSQGNRTGIDGIFFIRKNKTNTLKKLNGAPAASKIFQNSFPVFWKKSALEYIFDMCFKITNPVPCYDLGFVNDKNVVEFLKKELKEAK